MAKTQAERISDNRADYLVFASIMGAILVGGLIAKNSHHNSGKKHELGAVMPTHIQHASSVDSTQHLKKFTREHGINL